MTCFKPIKTSAESIKNQQDFEPIALAEETLSEPLEDTGTDTKQPLFLRLLFSKGLNARSFSVPGSISQLPSEELKDAWRNVRITVIDSNGKAFEVPKHLVSGTPDLGDTENPEGICRYGGMYTVGQTLTIKVDPDGLPEGYHNAYETGTFTAEKAFKKDVFDTFTLSFKLNYPTQDKQAMHVGVAWGMMDVLFDSQGGNWDGSTNPITKRVNKNNTVDFPTNPTKDYLQFSKWYTQKSSESPRIEFNSESYFSNSQTDWLWYMNDPAYDPTYDGIFRLRAEWTANVTLDSDNGSEADVISIIENETLSTPEQPSKAFAKFIEWQKDGQTYDFISPVTENMTLIAKWDDYTPVPQNVTLTQGEAFNPKDGIKNLVDMPEGTTVQAKAEVSTENYGEQTVTLVVEAPNENGTIDTKEVEITLTVNPRPLEINHAPQLEVVDKTIRAGDELDLKTLITQASDLEDGDDLTDKVEISSETFDNTKTGEYEISFTLTDSAGAKVTKNAKVTVEPKTYTITYDLAEGSLNGQTGIIKTVVEEGATIVLPEPSREGYALEYWQGSQYQPGDSYVVSEDHTFTAIWKAVEKPTEPSDTTAPSKPGETTEPTTKPSDTTAPTEPGNTTAPTKPSATTKPTVDNSVPQAGENNTAIVYGLLLIAGASVAIVLRRKENKAK